MYGYLAPLHENYVGQLYLFLTSELEMICLLQAPASRCLDKRTPRAYVWGGGDLGFQSVVGRREKEELSAPSGIEHKLSSHLNGWVVTILTKLSRLPLTACSQCR